MEDLKKRAIEQIVDVAIRSFAAGIANRHIAEKDNPKGTINSKRNNVFMRELGDEFIFYSALVRSFDSSFGNVLEGMGRAILMLNFDNIGTLNSHILPAQESKIQELIDVYSTDAQNRVSPKIDHYNTFTCIIPHNLTSFYRVHNTDHCFYDRETDTYFIMELKAGGDLDNKKAPAEKRELLKEYFMLKNMHPDKQVKLYFATAYNKFGEGNEWQQSSVKNCFAEEELLIGRDYWNFVCKDIDGFNVVMNQYRNSVSYIQEALEDIKNAYLNS